MLRMSACQKTFFDTLTDCKNVRKTSNSRPSAYMGTVGRELRSKSKSLRCKRFFIKKLENPKQFGKSKKRRKFLKRLPILTVPDFFDSLGRSCLTFVRQLRFLFPAVRYPSCCIRRRRADRDGGWLPPPENGSPAAPCRADIPAAACISW